MKRSFMSLSDFLTTLAYGLLFCGITTIPLFSIAFGSVSGCLYGLCFLPAIFLYYFFKRYCRLFILFVGVHLLALVFVIWMCLRYCDNLPLLCGIIVYFFIISIYSISQRLVKKPASLSRSTFFVSSACFLLAGLIVKEYAGISLFSLYAVLVAAIYLALLLDIQHCNMMETLSTVYEQSNQYARRIIRFNNRSIAVFMGFVVLIFLLASVLPLDSLIRSLLRGIHSFIKWLVSLLPNSSAETVETADQGSGEDPLSFLFTDEETQTRTPLIPPEVLQNIVLVLLAAAIVISVILFIRNLYRRFQEIPNSTGDVREFIEPEASEAFAAERTQFFFQWFGPQNRIRRVFYKTVRKYHRREKLPIILSETAEELTVRMSEADESPGLQDLCKSYNKVRYGSEFKNERF